MKKWIALLALLSACSTPEKKMIDIQGHRGARGLYPENTIVGFIEAVKLGVTTLELDLGVSADSQLIVTHEPYFSPEMCSDLSGNRMEEGLKGNLYQMTYEEIRQYNCGSLPHPRFPDQKKMKTSKPLLKEVFKEVEQYVIENNLEPVNYNIELKTKKETDNLYHPTPEVFSEMVHQVITEAGLWDRTNIQSFDFRTLRYFNSQYPSVRLALLIENKLPFEVNVDSLGFTPAIYSSDYQLLSHEIVGEIQKTGMLVIPWTVNETNEMQQLIDWGVDGIITDYPDRALKLVN